MNRFLRCGIYRVHRANHKGIRSQNNGAHPKHYVGVARLGAIIGPSRIEVAGRGWLLSLSLSCLGKSILMYVTRIPCGYITLHTVSYGDSRLYCLLGPLRDRIIRALHSASNLFICPSNLHFNEWRIFMNETKKSEEAGVPRTIGGRRP
jgi:hypothetical protein